MKNPIILVFTMLLVASTTAFSQKLPEITQEQKTMSMGFQPAFSILYENVEDDIVDDKWEDIMKAYDSKPKKNKSKELFSDDAEIEEMSKNTVDVYATITYDKATNNSYFSVWYDLGGMFLSPEVHPDKTVVVKTMLNQLSMDIMREVSENDLEEEEDRLKDLTKELEDLEEDKEDYEKEIQKAKEKIAEMEQKIEENITMQEKKRAQISTQETTVKDVKGVVEEYGGN